MLDTNFFGAYRVAAALLPLLRKSEHARIVNVSSGMGGVAEMGGWVARLSGLEGGPERDDADPLDRAAVTESWSTPLARASSRPTWAASRGKKSVEDGASGMVWLATLPDDGPRGGFFRDGKAIQF